MPHLRPRISLLTTLLLMTIVGMAIVIVRLGREVGPMRTEPNQLRDEVGRLSIDDPTRFHAIRVRSDNPHCWKWRIWVPEGREYHLLMRAQDVPKDGFPASHGEMLLDQPGESWIEYRITYNPQTKNWSDKMSTSTASIEGYSQPWVAWSRQTSTGSGVGYKTESFEPNKKILLHRERVSKKATSSDKIEDPSAGFMIWLEQTK